MSLLTPSSQNRPFDVSDFSGGITDAYVSGPASRYFEADNFLVDPNKKLIGRPGSKIEDETNYLLPVGHQRIGALIPFGSYLLKQSGRSIYYIDQTYKTLTGPSGFSVFSSGDANSSVSFDQWNGHLFITNDAWSKPQKIFVDESGALRCVTAGLPYMDAPSVSSSVQGTASYLYRFLYYRSYKIGDLTFEDWGPTTQVSAFGFTQIELASISISGIPVLDNGVDGNYDTSNIKVKIFRTIDAGTTFFCVGEVPNGTTTFTDSVSDSVAINSTLLYTEGGVVDNDPPPLSKFFTICNGYGYYGHVQYEGQTFKTRVVQSIKSDPDSVPASFYIDLDDEIVALGSTRTHPIVFCKKSIYRIDGTIDELGRGVLTAEKISDNTGGVGQLSLVRTVDGVYFAGTDGFYFTDAFTVTKISNEFNQTYKSLVSTETKKKRIYAAYEEAFRRVYWACQESDGQTDNDVIYVFDARFGIRPDGCFTTWSGGWNPTSLAFVNGNLYRGDKLGYTFAHLLDESTDTNIDQGVPPAQWSKSAVLWNYTSCALDLGSEAVKKWVSKIQFKGANVSDLSLTIYSINDDTKEPKALSPIRFRGNAAWGRVDEPWGDITKAWNLSKMINQQRRFVSGGLRCTYKQVQFRNAFTAICNSDLFGLATASKDTKTVTLNTGYVSGWPGDSDGYFISFSTDGYKQTYPIVSRTEDTLTIADDNGSCPDGVVKWEMFGYPKGEKIHILSYQLIYCILTDTQTMFDGNTGANA